MCLQRTSCTTPPLDFDKFNWKGEDIHELLCESNYIDIDDQIKADGPDLNIIHLNVRGINSKTMELNYLIEHSLKGQTPDIIALCETWLTKDSPTPNIPGYDFVHKCRTHKRGGGVALLISNRIRFKPLPDLKYEYNAFESCFIELKLNSRHLIVGSCYGPPNTNSKEFVKLHKQLLQKISQPKRSVIVAMDHNLDLLKSNIHHNTQQFLECNLQMELYPSIIRPTRITKTSATLIDNIFMSSDLYDLCNSWILIDNISDHLPCLLTIKGIKHKLKDPMKIESRNLKNLESLKKSLMSNNWDYINDVDCDINDCCERFFKELQHKMNEFIPVTTKTIPYHKLRREPWMTSGIQKSIKKEKTLYRQMIKRVRSPVETGLSVETKYQTYKSILQRIKRIAKQTFYHERCTQFKHNTKKLWETMNAAINKKHDKTSVIDELTINGISVTEPNAIANTLGNYFANVGETYAKKIPKSKRNLDELLKLIHTNINSLYFKPTTQLEILDIISKLPNKPSSGYDKISNNLLKEIKSEIAVPLVQLFNKSMSHGKFPNAMKVSEVVPLHKGKSKKIPENYRPISLLVTISKVLEKIIYKRVYDFLHQNGSLYQSQYGFRSNHSTDNAVTELMGDVLKNLENKKHTLTIFLDLSKAFDTLEHDMIYKKLSKYGIRGTCLEWFKSYLSDRTMSLKCRTASSPKEIISDSFEVKYGTPQGSCLGPLIFLIYCNDLHLNLNHTKCIQFADDTTLYIGSKHPRYLKYCLEEDLKSLHEWFNSNKLTLNIEKTVGLLFSPNGTKPNIKIELNSFRIPMLETAKFLGTWVDQNLSWKTHVDKLVLWITSRNALLKRGKRLLNKHALKVMYYAQIHSIIQYGIVIWGNMISKTLLNKLQKLQNTSVRLLENNLHTDDIYKRHNIPKINQQIQLENAKLWHRQQTDTLPSKLQSIMTLDHSNSDLHRQHRYSTRNKTLPRQPIARCHQYQNSLFVKGLADFATLPLELRRIKNRTTFISKVKDHILKC